MNNKPVILLLFTMLLLLQQQGTSQSLQEYWNGKANQTKSDKQNCPELQAPGNYDNSNFTFAITFDKKGQIINSPPVHVTKTDIILFDLSELKGVLEQRAKAYKKLNEATNSFITQPKQSVDECCGKLNKISDQQLFSAYFKDENCVKLQNDCSDDLQYYRPADLLIAVTIKCEGKIYNLNDLIPDKNYKAVLNLRSELDSLKIEAKQEVELSFGLQMPNKYNIMAQKHLQHLESRNIKFYDWETELPAEQLDILKNEMDTYYYQALQMQILDDKCGEDCKALSGELRGFLNKNCKTLELVNNAICKNANYVRNTLWLTGSPLINPLMPVNKDLLERKKIKAQQKIDILTKYIETLDVISKQTGGGKTETIVSNLLQKKDSNTVELIRAKTELEQINKQLEMAAKQELLASEKNRILYQGKLYISGNANSTFMRQHDAAAELNWTDQWLPFKQNYYEQNERVKVMVNNLPEKNVIKMDEWVQQIPDEKPLFTELAESAFGTLKMDALKDLIGLTSFVPKDTTGSNKEADCKAINEFLKAYAKVSWLSRQNKPTAIELKNTGPLYKTEVKIPNKSNKIPALVKYQLSVTEPTATAPKLVTDTFAYKVYKKQYVQLTAIAAFNVFCKDDRRRISNEFNTGNGTFTTIEMKPVDAVIGLKVFPLGLNIRRWLPSFRRGPRYGNMLIRRGDHVVNRFFITMGLSVSQKQLRNYFGGVGYEIVPGLGVCGGVNVYSKNIFEIENAQLKSSGEVFRHSWFVGVTVDPIVLIRASNLFTFKF